MARRVPTKIRRLADKISSSNNDTAELDIFLKNERGMLIDSTDIGDRMNRGIALLCDVRTSSIGKLNIGRYFCNDLADIVFLSIEKQDAISTGLEDTIYRGVELIDPVRIKFLRFKNENIVYRVCIALYDRELREVMNETSYFQILKYVLKSTSISEIHRQPILDEFEGLFVNATISLYTKMEIADIFLMHGREARGYEMLEVIRGVEAARAEVIRGVEPTRANDRIIQTVYTDSQNVHDGSLNASVVRASVELIREFPAEEFDYDEVLNRLATVRPDATHVMESVLNRIEIDTSTFRCTRDDVEGSNAFSLYHLFSSLWHYIQTHKHREDLEIRLIEEMVSMMNYCTTGHLSRLINVVQGFDEADRFAVRISNMSQIKSVIVNQLNTQIMKADEKVQESMMETDKTLFYRFIESSVNLNLPNMLREYGDDIIDSVLDSVIKYSQSHDWVEDSGSTIRYMPGRVDGEEVR
jgi:hypothetical protein